MGTVSKWAQKTKTREGGKETERERGKRYRKEKEKESGTSITTPPGLRVAAAFSDGFSSDSLSELEEPDRINK